MAYQPKSYKKFVATAATATLVVSAVAPVASAAKPAAEFTDVAPQYKEAVDYLVDNTIAAGKTPSTFGTAENIIRVDAAIWIAKATLTDGEISAAPASNFTDVPDRGVIYVDALKSKGYVNGTSATAFNAYANISRGEVAMILAEAYGITGNTADNKFTDVNSRYLAAVSALKDNGITAGKTSTRFGTGDAITRGELAIWVHRLETLGASTVSNVNVAVDGSKATVTADVKNVEDNTDATVSVYPNGNLSATPIVNSVKVVNGKVTSAFNEVPAGTHTVVVKVGEVSSSKSFTIAPASTPKVESVTAINAETVEVKFNTALDKDTFDKAGNFTITGIGSPGPVAVTDATLSADGKTVTLSVAPNLFVNDNQYTVTVDKELQTAAGTDFAKVDYTTNFLFSDKVAPSVSAVSTPNGDLRITFSEKISAPTGNEEIAVVIDGQSITLNATNTSATINDNVLQFSKAYLDANLDLTAGTNYSIAIAGAQDLVGNEMSLYTSNFTYRTITDTTPATVVAVTAKSEDAVNVKFSEEISEEFTSPKFSVKLNGETIASDAPYDSKDGVNYVLDLSGYDLYASGTTAPLEITISGVRDLGNNVSTTVTRSVTLTEDNVKPTLTTTTYNTTTDKAVLKFSEEVVKAASDATVTVINNATSQVVTTATAAVVAGTIEVSNLTEGSYTIRVDAAYVQDTSAAANKNAAFTTSVVVPKAQSTDEVKVTSATVSGDVLTVSYSAKVTGGTATTSASNPANYKLDGNVLPAGTVITLDTTSTIATITMPTGSITSTRTAILTVSNVKADNGTTVPTSNLLVNVRDTKAPVLNSAKVVGTELVLTFSEDVRSSTFDFADFNTEVNGVDVTEVVTAGANPNQLVINTTGASFGTGTVTVEVAPAANGTDLEGNVIVKGTKVTATR